MRKLKIFLTFSVCAVLQVQLARLIPFVRLVPVQLLLIFLIYYCLDYDWFYGLIIGVLAGAILDTLGGGNFGVYILSYGIIGTFIGFIQPLIFKEEFAPRILIVFIASIILQFISYNIFRIHQPNMPFIQSFMRSILPGAILDCAVAAPILILFKKRQKGSSGWNRDRKRA